ncbi:T9SS type A sorting domain-containing protein [candidate division WOR-3 bacterium]|nr:T9SS type A sorting domain-containing protein [candidate division WOR-3 bacterium]
MLKRSGNPALAGKRMYLLMCLLVAPIYSFGTMVYNVEPYDNENATGGVQQSFIATCDTIKYISFFCGEERKSGEYTFLLVEMPSGSEIASATIPSSGYSYTDVGVNFNVPVVHGKEYLLIIFHSSNLNYYYNSTNPYKYGKLYQQSGSDLSASVFGVNSVADMWGTCTNFYWISSDTLNTLFGLFNNAGINCELENISWFEIEQDSMIPNPQNWYWWKFDRIIQRAATHGVKLVGKLQHSPRWASTCDTSETDPHIYWGYPPVNLDSAVFKEDGSINPNNYWGYFIYNVVERYDGDGINDMPGLIYPIKYWEIWNEPNSIYGWIYPDWYYDIYDVTALCSLYVRLCEVAYQAAKAADPDANLLTCSISTVNLTNPGRWHVSGGEWVRMYYEYGGQDWCDGIAIHPYQYDNSLKMLSYFSSAMFQKDIDTIRTIMALNNDIDKELWITELGWTTFTEGVSQEMQANTVVQSFVSTIASAENIKGPVNHCLWYDFRNDGDSIAHSEHNFGLVYHDYPYVLKPAYYAYQQMTGKLDGLVYNKKLFVENDAIRVYEFENPQDSLRTWVMWKNCGIGGSPVLVGLAVRTDSAKYIEISYDGSPYTRTRYSGDNGYIVDISVDTFPIYMQELSPLSRPDVVIDSIWTNPSKPVVGDNVYLYCKIRNIGNASTPATIQDSIIFYTNDNRIALAVTPGNILPGGTAIVSSENTWTIDLDHCLMKVYADPSNLFIELNESNNTKYKFCDFERPQVTVISPDGGERFEIEDTCKIRWDATDNITPKSDILITKIEYSLDGGASWEEISDSYGHENDGEEQWIIPEISSYECKVKITAQDEVPNTGEVTSDNFSICWVTSDFAEATAYSNQRKLLYSTGELNLVFSSANNIYHSKTTDDGTKWQKKQSFGNGIFPAIGIDSEDSVNACWISANKSSLYYSRSLGTPELLLEAPVLSPSAMMISNDTVHLVIETSSSLLILPRIWRLKYCKFPVGNPGQGTGWKDLDSLVTGWESEEGGEPMLSPSIDVSNYPHITYTKSDSVYYINETDMGWSNPMPIDLGEHPFLDVEAGVVHLVWEANNDIWWKRISIDATPELISTAFEGSQVISSTWPQIIGGRIIVWAEEYPTAQIPEAPPSPLYEIHYKAWNGSSWIGPYGGTVWSSYNLSHSETVNSTYPQVVAVSSPAAVPPGPDWTLIAWCAWTEGNSSYEVKTAPCWAQVPAPSAPPCPFLYIWDGSEFVEDNNILAGSGQGDTVIDWYKLTQVPVKKNNRYVMEIREENSEHSWFDKIELLAVDHPDSVMIFVQRDGTILPLVDLLSPTLCAGENGEDYTDMVKAADEVYYQGYEEKSLVSEFERESTIEEYAMVLRPSEKYPPYLDIATYEDGEYEYIGSVVPREHWSTEAIALALSGEDTTTKVKITWHAPHKLDYIGLGRISAAEYFVKPCPLTVAVHSRDGSVKQKLLNDDEKYAELIPGDTIKIEFAITGTKPGWVRDFIFVSNGYYTTEENLAMGGAQSAGDGNLVFKLSQNYPNPFTAVTSVKWSVPKQCHVSLKIYDVAGRLVKTLVNGNKKPGYYTVKWDAKGFPSGIYFVKLNAGEYKMTKKLILMR